MANALGITVGGFGIYLLVLAGFVALFGVVLVLWSQENELTPTNKPTPNRIATKNRSDVSDNSDQQQGNSSQGSIALNDVQPGSANLSEAPAQAGSDNDQDTEQGRGKFWDFTAADLAVALFTALLFIVALQQSALVKDANKIAKDAGTTSEKAVKSANANLELVRNGQRAWISAIKPKIEKVEVGKKLKCSFELHNSGPTPGIVTAASASMKLGLSLEEIEAVTQNFNNFPYSKRETVIAPNFGHTMNPPEGELVTDELLADIEGGVKRLYLFGGCDYTDIYGVKHKTCFCFYYNPTAKQMWGNTEYNYMD